MHFRKVLPLVDNCLLAGLAAVVGAFLRSKRTEVKPFALES